MSGLEKLHRSELEALVVDMAKTAERYRCSIANIALAIEDEGDRAYFGSTNDADELRELEQELAEPGNYLACEWMHGTDLYADLRELREANATLLGALEDVMDILGTAESNASGNPEWGYIGPRVAKARAAVQLGKGGAS